MATSKGLKAACMPHGTCQTIVVKYVLYDILNLVELFKTIKEFCRIFYLIRSRLDRQGNSNSKIFIDIRIHRHAAKIPCCTSSTSIIDLVTRMKNCFICLKLISFYQSPKILKRVYMTNFSRIFSELKNCALTY